MKMLVVLFFMLFATFCKADDIVKHGDKRKNISLRPENNGAKYIASENTSLILFFENNQQRIPILFYANGKLPSKVSDEVLYNNLIALSQDFLKKFRPVIENSDGIGFSFLRAEGGISGDIMLVIKRQDIQLLDNRDWGVDDLSNQDNKLPFKEVVKRMMIHNVDGSLNTEKTKTFHLKSENYDKYSLFDTMIEQKFYGNNKAANKDEDLKNSEQRGYRKYRCTVTCVDGWNFPGSKHKVLTSGSDFFEALKNARSLGVSLCNSDSEHPVVGDVILCD